MPKRSWTQGMVAGMFGGLVGSLVLKGVIVTARSLHEGEWATDLDQAGPAHQVAVLAGERLLGRRLSEKDRKLGGEVVHYAFGVLVGGFYGAVAEYMPWTTSGAGALFGTGVFLGADESSMPALGLSHKPWEETAAAQAEHWLAHVAFGVVTEVSRRALRPKLATASAR